MSTASEATAAGLGGLAFITLAVTEGIGVPLFFIFLTLWLGVGHTGVADWSLWQVTAPLWVGAAASSALGFLALLALIKSVLDD